MKILHITPSSDGYEEVTLLANRISKNNGLALIEKNGQRRMTGGLLIQDTPMVRSLLDATPKKLQYGLISDIKNDPYAALYWDEKIGKVGCSLEEIFNYEL